ncbi:cystathionine gamma-synthase family protein [Acidovorax sp. SDU_ACID1]|uniref:cystathionine gamma-synthase family protein n=1 Tax=Acidovorax sp. SDU_ACID1 TaxID=3136632 RepID=UPI00387321E9
MNNEHPSTRILHSDRRGGVEHGAVHKPSHNAVTFGYPTARDLADVFQGGKSGFVYGRQGNPTTAALETKINLMEGAVGTVTFATGMAAISAMSLALLNQGDHIIASRYLFGNTASWLDTLSRLGVAVSLVDATEVGAVAAALRPETRFIFVETIANPGTQVADLAGIGRLCHEHRLLYVVDNTMTTPVMLRGHDVGAGLVVHSLSKSISGHGNALGGSISDTGIYDWTAYPNILPAYQGGPPHSWGLLQIKKKGLRDTGGTLSAEQAHRIAIGAETLDLRVERASSNALALARWLEGQPRVRRVLYPGLPSHPQHLRARELFGGRSTGRFGSLLSFELREGIDPFALLDALRIVVKSSHLGDNRTLALPAAHTIFFEMGPDKRQSMGISDGLVRVSAGIEAEADLIADFARAFSSLDA